MADVPRLIPIDQLPTGLWKGKVVHLPKPLVAAYAFCLEKFGLLDVAKEGTQKKDIHGGISEEETYEHFAHRFGVSSARQVFVVLDPTDSLSDIPNAILSTFSQGHVAVLDIPCGAISATGSLLGTLSLLRSEGVVPRLPLTVSVTGGDISDAALNLATEMNGQLATAFEAQGIEVHLQLKKWDATQAEETAQLVDDWLAHAGSAAEFVVCISNFSGALIHAKKWEDFQPALEHILARLYGRKATLLWIEPLTADATARLIPKIRDYLARRLPTFFGRRRADGVASAPYLVRLPMKEIEIPSGMSVERFWRR